MSIKWVQPSRSTGRSAESAPLRMTFHCESNSKNGVRRIGMLLSKELMKELRWCVGDRVDIGFDHSMIFIRRSVNGAYAVSPTGIRKHEVLGKMTRAKVAFTEQASFPTVGHESFSVERKDIDICPDGIVSFLLPDRQATSVRAIS